MACFGFFAPSGFVRDTQAVERAAERLRGLGHTVVLDESLLCCDTRFAGDDDTRLAAIERIASDSRVDVAVALRGGYGLTRLLDRIDFARLAGSGKVWVGHSDLTALQCGLLCAGGVSLHGPMVVSDFGAESVSDFTLEHFGRMLETGHDGLRIDVAQGWCGALEGPLWGGNLSMLAHLVGTPWMPVVDGGILYLEDVAEPPFRIERMLHQLHFAGVLDRQRALLLGDFGGYRPGATDNGFDFDAMVRYLRERFDVPILTGLPFGHVADKLSLPFGGIAALESDEGGWSLDYRLEGVTKS